MILTINAGSSSIKFAIYQAADPLQQMLLGSLENIGLGNVLFCFHKLDAPQKESMPIQADNHDQAAALLIDWLKKQQEYDAIIAIGHRVVHGMEHSQPEIVTQELLIELKQISGYDPEHLPEEIKLIELFGQHYPSVVQLACFDTAFHSTMPPVAKMLSIPRKYFNKGIHRYGFHGLSYAYLMEELKHIEGEKVAEYNIILAHLGSGASITAVKEGKSIDTSMGFTPASGLAMSTRSGDLDPGVAWYLMKFEQLNPKQFNHLINHESGLLGISETSADIRALQELENTDSRAAEAIDFFCYQTKKWIGSYAAVLNGLDILVFSGGIGEHSPEIRSKICDGLAFLGIELCEIKNMNNEAIISTKESKVIIRIINTNEEIMIAKLVLEQVNR